MNIKIFFVIITALFFIQHSLCAEADLTIPCAEADLTIPLDNNVAQQHEETLLIEGNDPDWGGKFKLKEMRNIKNDLSVTSITHNEKNDLLYDLTITLKNFEENILSSSSRSEEDETSNFFDDELEKIYNLPIQAKFNGEITLNGRVSEEYLLLDTGLQFFFRHLFITVEKDLEVGKTLVQQFFFRPDDAITSIGETLPLEFIDFWEDIDGGEDYDDVEPILLIKYTITKITDAAVYADISGELLTASANPSMKPSFGIKGKGVWQKSNPMINEISFDFDYSEKRKKSWMKIKGSRKTKSYLPLSKCAE